MTIPKKSDIGQLWSTVNGQLDRTRRVQRRLGESRRPPQLPLMFPFYSSSIPLGSTRSSWKNRGATPTPLAESEEQLDEFQTISKLLAESVHRTRRVHAMQSIKLLPEIRFVPKYTSMGPSGPLKVLIQGYSRLGNKVLIHLITKWVP